MVIRHAIRTVAVDLDNLDIDDESGRCGEGSLLYQRSSCVCDPGPHKNSSTDNTIRVSDIGDLSNILLV
ncbi:hypothetical protein A5784_16355 [Mycobacterium sp. 852013-50091_SCH5140682]|nr:hypothetical protein A5784_16355 [Mycobacterium sp. 852013-50091_SCH5140682]